MWLDDILLLLLWCFSYCVLLCCYSAFLLLFCCCVEHLLCITTMVLPAANTSSWELGSQVMTLVNSPAPRASIDCYGMGEQLVGADAELFRCKGL